MLAARIPRHLRQRRCFVIWIRRVLWGALCCCVMNHSRHSRSVALTFFSSTWVAVEFASVGAATSSDSTEEKRKHGNNAPKIAQLKRAELKQSDMFFYDY